MKNRGTCYSRSKLTSKTCQRTWTGRSISAKFCRSIITENDITCDMMDYLLCSN